MFSRKVNNDLLTVRCVMCPVLAQVIVFILDGFMFVYNFFSRG
jgi:hypothetical protein